MSNFSTLTVELPGSNGTFEFQGDIEFTPQGRPAYTINAGNGATAVAEDLFGASDSTSPKANVYLGFGQGERQFSIRFVSWTGEGNTFGELGPDATAGEKAQHLEHELSHREIDSRNPVTISYGLYTESGLYSPLTVVPKEYDTPFVVGESETINEFTGEITFAEAYDANNALQPANPL